MTNLTKYDIAFIGIRLLTIYLILQIIPTIIWSISILLGQTFPESLPFMYKLLMGCLLFLTLLIPIFLWILSDKIAKLIIKSSSTVTENANLKDMQSIIFSAIGVFIFVMTVPDLIVGIYVLINAYVKTQHFYGWQGLFDPKLTANFLKLMLSLILIFKANGLSKLLNKIRYAG